MTIELLPQLRTPVRLNGSSVPKPAKDFYERLFWYGFDADETEGIGDKTVFGGTKGKFNGLSYIEASETNPYQRQNRRPRRKRDNEYYEDEYVADDYDVEYFETSTDRTRSTKPPSDTPFPRADSSEAGSRRRGRRRARRSSNDFDNDRFESENPGDWVQKSVSSWFTGYEDRIDDGEFDGGSGRRRRRQESSDWSPFSIVDKFFGVDRNEMQYKADLYNEKMGLGKRRRSSSQDGTQERSRRPTPRRPGYAYKYDEEYDEELSPIVDIGLATPEDNGNITNDTQSSDTQRSEAENLSGSKRKRKEKSWEERALAVERVPPAGIPAWGPSGEMPCDARTKAIMDALEDIQIARHKLEKRLKKEALAEEEITILKV